MKTKSSILSIVTVAIFCFAAGNLAQAATITHLFDMQAFIPANVEPGWTMMHNGSNYVAGTTAGFDFANSDFVTVYNNGSSPQAPTLVTQDAIYGISTNTGKLATLLFKDVAPANVSSATFTIYYSAPGSSYIPHFNISAKYNSDATMDFGSVNNALATGGIFTPFVGTLSLTPSGSVGEFAFFLNAPVGNTQIILNGIQIDYTTVPEPSYIAIVALGSLGLLAWRRRRQAA